MIRSPSVVARWRQIHRSQSVKTAKQKLSEDLENLDLKELEEFKRKRSRVRQIRLSAHRAKFRGKDCYDHVFNNPMSPEPTFITVIPGRIDRQKKEVKPSSRPDNTPYIYVTYVCVHVPLCAMLTY